VKKLIQTSGIGRQNIFETGVVLLRNTTWKCGKVERLIIDYLRRHIHHHKKSNPSMKEILEHFVSKGKKNTQVMDAVDRLENRGIIKLVSNTSDENLTIKTKRGKI
jgi:hypothetical protein